MSRITVFELENYDNTRLKVKTAREQVPFILNETESICSSLSDIAVDTRRLTLEEMKSSDFYDQALEIVNKCNNMGDILTSLMSSLLLDTLDRINTVSDNSESFQQELIDTNILFGKSLSILDEIKKNCSDIVSAESLLFPAMAGNVALPEGESRNLLDETNNISLENESRNLLEDVTDTESTVPSESESRNLLEGVTDEDVIETPVYDGRNLLENINIGTYNGTVNGKDIDSTITTGYNDPNCWNYAQTQYKNIWGSDADYSRTYFGEHNVVPVGTKFSAENLHKYLSQTEPGAVMRADKTMYTSESDSAGHSLIFLGENENGTGARFAEGNADGNGLTRIRDWEYDALADWYLNNRGYTYIKYISYPGAETIYD